MIIRISSRVFSNGFEITTPAEILSAKKSHSSFREMHIFNASGTQIARLGQEQESFFRTVYNIIISGGGFYQFGRDKSSSRIWSCRGDGKLYQVSEGSRRRFDIVNETEKVAEYSKALFANDYAITVINEAETKLVICIVIALSLSEHQWTDILA